MAISLATGSDWMGFPVCRATRTALISREDNPALTGWRLRHLFLGKPNASWDLLKANLYVNSRAQTGELMLDNPEQMQQLVASLQRRGIEFAIFDVFNVMHAADENDNTEMRGILRELSRIQAETGCGIGVVHHYSKSETGNGCALLPLQKPGLKSDYQGHRPRTQKVLVLRAFRSILNSLEVRR